MPIEEIPGTGFSFESLLYLVRIHSSLGKNMMAKATIIHADRTAAFARNSIVTNLLLISAVFSAAAMWFP